eukprot:gene15857-17844_t
MGSCAATLSGGKNLRRREGDRAEKVSQRAYLHDDDHDRGHYHDYDHDHVLELAQIHFLVFLLQDYHGRDGHENDCLEEDFRDFDGVAVHYHDYGCDYDCGYVRVRGHGRDHGHDRCRDRGHGYDLD